MPFAPTPQRVAHIVRYEDTTNGVDEHGNYPIVDEPPVIRHIYDISQFGRRGSSSIVQGPEFQDRVETTIHLSVPYPELFSSGDQILLDFDVDVNGDYVPGTGIAYWVDGEPAEDRLSPWPRYTKNMGGVVKIRRVT